MSDRTPVQSAIENIASRLSGSLASIRSLEEQTGAIEAAARRVVDCLARGGTIYTAGNGGSAAEAMHLSEELIGRYRSNRPARRAVCLNADPAALTCIANDFGYENVFRRQCEALLTGDDVLVVLSTSGRSANIVEALGAVRERGVTTIGLLGGDGGQSRDLCDQAIVVPSDDSAHVQEAHLVIVHLICEAVEGM